MSTLRAEDPGFDTYLGCGHFSRFSDTSELKIGTSVATLSGTWRYRVSAGTDQPGVHVLRLGEIKRLICNFCLSVTACKFVRADPSMGYTSLLLGRQASKQASNQPTSSVYCVPCDYHLSDPCDRQSPSLELKLKKLTI